MKRDLLAQLAATLAHGRNFDREDARRLVKLARLLLDAAQEHIDLDTKLRTESDLASRQRMAETPAIPKTPEPDKAGAISLRRFLRSLGFTTETDGLPLYRKYLATYWKNVDAIVARDRAEGIPVASYPAAATQFARWLKEHRAQAYRARASKGGKGKQAKAGAEAAEQAKRKSRKNPA
jgi:hypothetical protein